MPLQSNTRVERVTGRQVFDSRGNPTVEVDVLLQDGSLGRGAVPSGASTGQFEAVELRDGGTAYVGKGVLKAVGHVNAELRKTVEGRDGAAQYEIDQAMITADGSANKGRLGANALLGVSMAVARAAAASRGQPLYAYLGGIQARRLPVPMMNIINGGAHADNNVDVQEFMVLPTGAKSFAHAMQVGSEIYHALKGVLKARKLATGVGDEGGFAPNLRSNEEAIQVILEAVGKAGYKAGTDVKISLDVAASEFYKDGKYHLEGEGKTLSVDQMVEYYSGLVDRYPIYSIEDPLDQNDWGGWSKLTQAIGHRVRLVGDDLFVTNLERLGRGIREKIGNAILIKLNQIGTVTETLQAIDLAHRSGFASITSHRSGETEDSFIADLAVATDAGLIKTGAPCRSDRVAKYNQLLRIEESSANEPSMAFADDEKREEPPNFWNELYWFGLISLGGLALALLVLAPKLAKHRSTLDTEDGLRAAVARLDLLEKQYEAAIEAMESDPFYREEVLRAVLKVKKSDEELLKESARASDN